MAITIGGVQPWRAEVAKTTDYQVLKTDSGSLLTTTGAGGSVTFTLPTLVNGVGCSWYFLNVVDQAMAITAPTGKLIIDGNAAATTGTYQTASHQIGSFCRVVMNAAGTFYILVNEGATTLTVS